MKLAGMLIFYLQLKRSFHCRVIRERVGVQLQSAERKPTQTPREGLTSVSTRGCVYLPISV